MHKLGILGICGLLLATPAFAAGYSDGHGRGGTFGDYDPIISKYNASGELFIIRGRCQSACTLFLSIRNACVASNAGRDLTSTSRMLNSYKRTLRDHLVSVGALQGRSYCFISGRDVVTRFGYRACPRGQ